jgi:hypothetical protein
MAAHFYAAGVVKEIGLLPEFVDQEGVPQPVNLLTSRNGVQAK